jgi:hypothetical protein
MFKLLSIKKRADGFESPGDNDFITKDSGEQDMDILADGPQRDLGPNTEISTIGADDDPDPYSSDGFDSQEGGNGFPMDNQAMGEPQNPGTDDTNLKEPDTSEMFGLIGHP